MIQTHEYNQSHKNKNICVSLFKREEELTGIIPLTIYKTYCFPLKNDLIHYNELDARIKLLTGDKLNCKLFNIQGQLVSEFNLSVVDGKVSQTLEMSKKLASGTYYLGIYQNNKAQIKQFVKE